MSANSFSLRACLLGSLCLLRYSCLRTLSLQHAPAQQPNKLNEHHSPRPLIRLILLRQKISYGRLPAKAGHKAKL